MKGLPLASTPLATRPAKGVFSERAVSEEASSMELAPPRRRRAFTAIVGLVGSVVGFYFGSQKSSG